MIEWEYSGEGWLDVWTDRDARCMIVRHPRHDEGRFVIWIRGERVAAKDQLGFAKWKAENLLEGEAR